MMTGSPILFTQFLDLIGTLPQPKSLFRYEFTSPTSSWSHPFSDAFRLVACALRYPNPVLSASYD